MLETCNNTVGVLVEGKGNEVDQIAEAYDFCVEDLNKKLKTNLSAAPTSTTWLIACRTLKFFENMNKKMSKVLKYFRLSCFRYFIVEQLVILMSHQSKKRRKRESKGGMGFMSLK
jgi:hypothetical protein